MIWTAKISAIVGLASFGAGFLAGTVFVYERWNVSNLSVQAAQYRHNLQELGKITGTNAKIDEDAEATRKVNNEILRKIEERLRAAPPAADGSDPECIDADSMQDIRSIE